MASYFGLLDALLQRPEFAQAAGKPPGSDSTGASKGGLALLSYWRRTWKELCPVHHLQGEQHLFPIPQAPSLALLADAAMLTGTSRGFQGLKHGECR